MTFWSIRIPDTAGETRGHANYWASGAPTLLARGGGWR